MFERPIEAPDPAIESAFWKATRSARPTSTNLSSASGVSTASSRLTDRDDVSLDVTWKASSLPVDRLLETGRAIAAACPKGSMRSCLGRSRAARRGIRPICMSRATLTGSPRWKRRCAFSPRRAGVGLSAWDGVPYDRVAPNGETIARRIATLAALSGRAPDDCSR